MFNSKQLQEEPGSVLFSDELRTVELTTAFKRIRCYNCDFVAVYRYVVQELRRSNQPPPEEAAQSATEYFKEQQNAIPRYAEIPETVKCQSCREVLGLYTSCIY